MENTIAILAVIWTFIICVLAIVAGLLYDRWKSDRQKRWRRWYDESKSGICDTDYFDANKPAKPFVSGPYWPERNKPDIPNWRTAKLPTQYIITDKDDNK